MVGIIHITTEDIIHTMVDIIMDGVVIVDIGADMDMEDVAGIMDTMVDATNYESF